METFIQRETANQQSISTELEEVAAKLDNLHADIQWLRNQNEETIEALAQNLYQIFIPLPAHDSKAGNEKAIQVVAFEDNQQPPTSLAKKLGTTPKQGRNAIDYLKNHGFSDRIEQYEMEDGTLQFFKKGEED